MGRRQLEVVNMDPMDLIPIPLAAKRILKSETTLRRGVQTGQIKGMRLGREWFIPRVEVDRLAAEYPVAPVAVSARG
jgi:hypothetical protein